MQALLTHTHTPPATTIHPPPQKPAAGASLTLKSSADFAALAKDLGPKFKKAASSKDVTGFVSELLAKGAKEAVTSDDINELIKCTFSSGWLVGLVGRSASDSYLCCRLP